LANSLHHEPLELKGKDQPTESSLFILHFRHECNESGSAELQVRFWSEFRLTHGQSRLLPPLMQHMSGSSLKPALLVDG